MIKYFSAEDRGQAHYSWLEARHSFSFGDYYDEDKMGWGSLRVINEDKVQPGKGFPKHGHKNMEIITWVLDGNLEHKDDMGGHGVLTEGQLQYMSAGSGVNHSEYNASETDMLHLMQIWIIPNSYDDPPLYEQKDVDLSDLSGRFYPLLSQDGRDDTIKIRQDASIFAARLDGTQEISYQLESNREYFLQVARGSLYVQGHKLNQGDGLGIEGENIELILNQGNKAEVLFFDMGK